MVARVKAGGTLDGAVAVYRVIRSQKSRVVCARTNRNGRALVSWYAFRGGSYLVAVAQREGSAAGSFQLSVLAAEPMPRPPGDPLPTDGARGTVDPILDAVDAWAISMTRGTTYRINLTSASNQVRLELYRPNTYSFTLGRPVRAAEYGGYLVFTPGIDGGGVYSVVARTHGYQPVRRPYRLHAAAAREDDVAPGIKLANGQLVQGAISGRGVDLVDLYRFTVPHPNALTTIRLQQKPNVGLDLRVLGETGRKVAGAIGREGRQVLRLHLRPGRYFVAVQSRQKSSGKYGLQVLTRDITSTSISANGSTFLEVTPGTSVPITVSVTSVNNGGRVAVAFDRHDPLAGWHFSSVLARNVNATGTLTVTWTPPSVGYWRVRARFIGSPFSSFSQSGYVRVHVAEPLE